MTELKTSKCSEAAKLLGEKWQKLSDSDKKIYFDMAKTDGLRHDKQVKELKELGYFFHEDGSKSTDQKKSKKRTHQEANQDKNHNPLGGAGMEDSELGAL